MSLNKIFINFVVGFLVGILLSNILISIKLILIFLSLSVVFSLGILIFMRKYHFFVLVLIFGLFLGSFYSFVNNSFIEKRQNILNEYYEKEVAIKGEIDYLYKNEESYNSYIVKLLSINDNESLKVKFLLKTSKNIKLNEKEIIFLKSKVDRIDNFGEFNYKKYLLTKGIYFQISFPSIEFSGINNQNILDKIVIQTRQIIITEINKIYPRAEGAFLAGILIGAKENITDDMMSNFNNSGLTHLMAVSGFNITIIIVFLGFLFKFIPVYFRFLIISLFVVFFTLVTGDNVSVLRASIMGILAYFILISGRKGNSLSIILFTAFILVLFNPLYLNYDVSFHLSFLAVLGLLYTQKFWSKIFFFLPKFFAIRESFILTLSALTTTLPIMIFNFGQISILSPISNLLVGGIIPISMFLGFLSILGNLINEKIGFIIGFPTFFLLKFVNIVAEYFGNLSFSVLKFDYEDYFVYLEVIYFMILIFLIVYFQKEREVLEEEKKEI